MLYLFAYSRRIRISIPSIIEFGSWFGYTVTSSVEITIDSQEYCTLSNVQKAAEAKNAGDLKSLYDLKVT